MSPSEALVKPRPLQLPPHSKWVGCLSVTTVENNYGLMPANAWLSLAPGPVLCFNQKLETLLVPGGQGTCWLPASYRERTWAGEISVW